MAAISLLGMVHQMGQPQRLQLASTTRLLMKDGKLVYLPPMQLFRETQDWSQRQAVLQVKLPSDRLVASLRVTDARGRSQSSRWTEGQPTSGNPNYDSQRGVLTLRLRPTLASVDEQGHSDEGFDPTQIRSVQLFVSPNGQHGLQSGQVEILSQSLKDVGEPPPAAQLRPLLGSNHHPPAPLKGGVSRYFVYGDLNRWQQARPLVESAFSEQQQAGLHAFRSMGGLDLRSGRLDPQVFPAMRDYLQLAEQYGQSDHIFTLLDGAIPNAALQRAFENPAEAEQLVEQLRPFIREFGNARVGGRPVVFDLVNEIHGTPGPESAKQQFVERLVDTFVKEAPGARLTVGVQNFRELKYWTYLFEKYQDQPVSFAMSFHLYEPIENVPDRSTLHLPDNVEVGITEADPQRGMASQVEQARAKGYDWLLFWQDSSHPYNPALHGQLKP